MLLSRTEASIFVFFLASLFCAFEALQDFELRDRWAMRRAYSTAAALDLESMIGGDAEGIQ